MDSGNSGSMQSSSGGDEEYDSRADSIAAFLNPPGHVGPMPNPPPPPPPSHHHHHHHHHHHTHPSSSSMFDPLSNYFDPLSRSPTQLQHPNSLLNLDMAWSRTLRSDPNCTEIGGGGSLLSSSSSPASAPSFSGVQGQTREGFPTSLPSLPFPPGPENAGRAPPSSSSTDQANAVRNPKKRSRASRRAPTTVLTTDTTNFRAMVQEFTGIPAQPFTSSPFPRSRLDLFGAASAMRSGHLDPAPPPSYLLRPFAQKLQPPPPPFPPSSSSSPSSSASSLADAIASTTSNSTTGTNYQLPSHLMKQQPQNLLNMNVQNPILSIQSFLQTPLKYPLPNSSIIGAKQPQQAGGSLEIPTTDTHIKIGGAGLEDFGLSHGHGGHVNARIGGLPNLVPSDRTASRTAESNNPPSWSDGLGLSGGDHHHHTQLGPLNGNYNNNSQRATNGKINYSTSSSDFHGDKGPENVPTRSEGMVESWICSSD